MGYQVVLNDVAECIIGPSSSLLPESIFLTLFFSSSTKREETYFPLPECWPVDRDGSFSVTNLSLGLCVFVPTFLCLFHWPWPQPQNEHTKQGWPITPQACSEKQRCPPWMCRPADQSTEIGVRRCSVWGAIFTVPIVATANCKGYGES